MLLRAFFLVLLLALRPALAGLVITSETRELNVEGPSETVVFLLGEGQLRLDSGKLEDGKPAMSVIFDEKTQAMVNIDHQARAYREFTETNIEAFSKRSNDLQKRVDDKLDELSPDKREVVEELMKRRLAAGARPAEDRAVTKTDERQQIGKFACTKYEVTSGEQKKRDLWVARWDDIGVVRGTFKVFSSMSSFYKKVVTALSFWSRARPEPNPMGDFDSLDGFPILIKHYRNGEVVRETTFKSFETRELTAELFQPPADYTKQVPFPAEGS